jgi:DsbE subfamily thiol:disulfide oxidoreductase
VSAVDVPSGGELAEAPPRRRRLAPWVASAVGVVVVGFLVVLATRPPAADRQGESPLLFRAAPALRGVTLDGKQFDIDNQRGKWVLVNFFASWCIPCKLEHPELRKLVEQHQPANDLSVVSVAFQDDDASIRSFFEENGGSWPVLAAGQGSTVLDYGVFKLPESYLVSPSGQVVHKFVGGVTAEAVDERIAAVKQAGGG